MKKIIHIALALLLTAGTIHAQEPERKRGGFLNAIKKGVESTTGLNVSKEALFVYPQAQMGEWKISLVSCLGNREFGSVTLTLKIIKISGGQSMAERCLFTEAETTDGVALGFGRYSADPLWDFRINTPVEVEMMGIGGVPEDATAINVKFYIGSFADPQRNIFEGRDIPIQWVE